MTDSFAPPLIDVVLCRTTLLFLDGFGTGRLQLGLPIDFLAVEVDGVMEGLQRGAFDAGSRFTGDAIFFGWEFLYRVCDGDTDGRLFTGFRVDLCDAIFDGKDDVASCDETDGEVCFCERDIAIFFLVLGA